MSRSIGDTPPASPSGGWHRALVALLISSTVLSACRDDTPTEPAEPPPPAESTVPEASVIDTSYERVDRTDTPWRRMDDAELALAVEAGGGLAIVGFKEPTAQGGVRAGRALVSNGTVRDVKDDLRARGLSFVYEFQLIPAVLVVLPSHQLSEVRADARVEYVEPNYGGSLSSSAAGRAPRRIAAPNSSAMSGQVVPWGVQAVGAPSAWNVATASGVTVFILDTGLPDYHRDLPWLAGGACYSNDPEDAYDATGHGTHVGGIVAAADNAVDVVGVAHDIDTYWENVWHSGEQAITAPLVACSIETARLNDADVVNMSFHFGLPSTAVIDEIEGGYGEGVVFVAAAGNSFQSSGVQFPADMDEVVAVAATDSTDQAWTYSPQGQEIELAAPGVDVLSTVISGDGNSCSVIGSATTGLCTGTSMAAPHVTGAVALLRERYPGWTPSQIRARLQSTAEDLGSSGHDNVFGHGLLDVAAAVSWSATISGPSSVDSGVQETWTASVDGGQTPLSYEWYVDGVLSGTSSQLTITTPSDNFILDLEVTDDAGAETGDSKIIFVCGSSGPC